MDNALKGKYHNVAACSSNERENIKGIKGHLDSGLESVILKIYVYQPYIRIRSIKLDSNYTISILNSIYPSNSKYLFKGQILILDKTFKDYNIRNDETIVLISDNMMKSEPNSIQRWLNLTNRKDFEEKINLNIKTDYRKEISRIKDIKYFKFENKRKKFDNYLKSQINSQNKFSNWAYESNDNKAKGTNTNYRSLKSPSCDPLPIVW